MKNPRIGFIGGGKMAEGILSAIAVKSAVMIGEKLADRAEYLRSRYGVKATDDIRAVAGKSDLVFLAVRPQDVGEVALALRGTLGADKTLVSIVAGKKLAFLRSAFGRKVRLVRVMPNLALRAGEGMCAVTAPESTPKAAVDAVRKILDGAGKTVVLKEKDFDAVTALSGSGPAYFAYMEEAMAEAGEKLGLERDVARLLAGQTMYGTAKFLRESGMELEPFIAGVCTKGGTTAAGMEKLSAPQFKKIVFETLKAAAKRSRELA